MPGQYAPSLVSCIVRPDVKIKDSVDHILIIATLEGITHSNNFLPKTFVGNYKTGRLK